MSPTESLTGHLKVAEILIYENSLEEIDASCQPGSMPDGAPPVHVEMLWASARAVHAFLTNRLAGGVTDYPRFIRLSSFDLTYVFITLLKLVTLPAPGWDLARVREELHFDGRKPHHMSLHSWRIATMTPGLTACAWVRIRGRADKARRGHGRETQEEKQRGRSPRESGAGRCARGPIH